MKLMKKTMKCLVAVLMMAMAFAVTGITAQAAEAPYVPTTWSNLAKTPQVTAKYYTVPADGSVVIPVKVANKGGLSIAYVGYPADGYSYDSMYMRVYNDAACTSMVSGTFSSVYESVESDYFSFNKKATYYIKVESYADVPQTFGLSAVFINGANRTITSGKTTAIYQNDSSKWVYTKYKATKTGYLSVSASAFDNRAVYVKLLNSAKKAVSSEETLYSSSNFYGVQKGKTYYIVTKTNGTAYNLSVKLSSVKEKSGSKKAKAVTMKRNKNYKGLQIANRSKSGSDWYKIKLTSSKAITFVVNGRTTGNNGSLKFKITGGPRGWRNNVASIPAYSKNAKSVSTNRLSAGTYYIQVYKTNKYASGYYTIKWK